MPFEKGHKPWNKNLKIQTNTGSTHFKKGQHVSPSTEYKKGNIPWLKGKHHTEKARLEISEKNKGKIPHSKGKTWEEEYGFEKSQKMKKRLSEANKGKILSIEHRNKISEGNKGRKVTKGTRKKISISNKISQRKYWDGHPELRKEYSERMKGREISTETRKKMSKSSKGKGTGKQKNRCWDEERKKKWGIRVKMEFKTGKRVSWFKNHRPDSKKLSEALLKHWDKIGRKKKRKRCFHPSSGKYREWRTAVFEYDVYTCWVCGNRGNQSSCYLEAHHLKSWANYPKLRFDVSNGVTLCKECHLIFK